MILLRLTCFGTTMADTCFCQNGLSQFKPLMAEICHP